MESCSRELEESWNFPNYIGAIALVLLILFETVEYHMVEYFAIRFYQKIYQKLQLAFQTQDMLNLVESYDIPDLESLFIVRS